MNREVCGNCVWFERQLEVSNPVLEQFAGNPVYGKCRAEFTAETGEPVRMDFGTFSTSPCEAIDDEGRLLFTPEPNVPENFQPFE